MLAETMLDNAALKDLLGKMYDLPRPGKVRDRVDDGSPPKCIRPLASGLLLQPGHDEIRAHSSQINGPCTEHAFLPRAYSALIDCFVITFPEPRFLPRPPLRRWPDLCVRKRRLVWSVWPRPFARSWLRVRRSLCSHASLSAGHRAMHRAGRGCGRGERHMSGRRVSAAF